MPVEIVVGVNSYIDITDADKYFNERLFSDVWLNALADDKAKSLITASRKIDRQVLEGIKASSEQPMQFPRSEQTEIPKAVIDATCEEALALLENGNSSRLKLQRQGVKSMSLGDISESYSGNTIRFLSQEAKELMKPYLSGSVSVC